MLDSFGVLQFKKINVACRFNSNVTLVNKFKKIRQKDVKGLNDGVLNKPVPNMFIIIHALQKKPISSEEHTKHSVVLPPMSDSC